MPTPLESEKYKEKALELVQLGFSNSKVSRARKRRRGQKKLVHNSINDIQLRQAKRRNKPDPQARVANTLQKVEDVITAYSHIERRELIDDMPDEMPQLGGVYSAGMIKYTIPASDEAFDFCTEEPRRGKTQLHLPPDGSIFLDGIPFHHLVLTQLREKHIRRLYQNGIKLLNRHFSSAEDQQIIKNWLEFAALNNLDESEADKYVSAATIKEENAEHRERLKFIKEQQFRPHMCKRLLNRTCSQVFRRSYQIFHLGKIEFDGEPERAWTPTEDKKLLELYNEYGPTWEKLGSVLHRTRFSVQRRFLILQNSERNEFIENNADAREIWDEGETITITGKWNEVETSKLYKFLCDHTLHHPIIIALKRKYQSEINRIDWSDNAMHLPHRSAEEREKRWEELSDEIRDASERLHTNKIKDLEKALSLGDALQLSRAKSFSTLNLTTEKLSQCAAILAEEATFAITLRNIDMEQVMQRLHEQGVISSDQDMPSNAGKRILRRIKWAIFLCEKHFCFDKFPIQHNELKVRLEFVAYLFGKMKSFCIKKKKLRKYVKKFLRSRGWEQRNPRILVDKSLKCTEDDLSETINQNNEPLNGELEGEDSLGQAQYEECDETFGEEVEREPSNESFQILTDEFCLNSNSDKKHKKKKHVTKKKEQDAILQNSAEEFSPDLISNKKRKTKSHANTEK